MKRKQLPEEQTIGILKAEAGAVVTELRRKEGGSRATKPAGMVAAG